MKKKTIILIMAGIAAAGIGVGIYFWYDGKQKEKKLAAIQKDSSLVDHMSVDEVIGLLIKQGKDITGWDLSAKNEVFLKSALKDALNYAIKK